MVILTGGLGPTVDDVTREAVAAATGCELVIYPECLAQIEALMGGPGRPLKDNNRRQAYLPTGATPIPNPVGTAPGFILETVQGTIIAVPGVPREMERLMQDTVLPYLKARLGAEQAIIKARVLRTVGLPESSIDEAIDLQMRSANPTVGLAAHLGMVDIRITARAVDTATADAMIAEMEAEIRSRIDAEAIYGTGADLLEAVTGRLLAQIERQVAILETATGGEIARLLSSTPEGASVVTRALVVDGPEALATTLDMSPAKLGEFGWVSEMVAAEAAAWLIDTYEGGWGLVVLGQAEDDGDVFGEHPGESYLALSTPSTTRVLRYPYGGTGELARRWITLRGLDVLRREALKRIALETQ